MCYQDSILRQLHVDTWNAQLRYVISSKKCVDVRSFTWNLLTNNRLLLQNITNQIFFISHRCIQIVMHNDDCFYSVIACPMLKMLSPTGKRLMLISYSYNFCYCSLDNTDMYHKWVQISRRIRLGKRVVQKQLSISCNNNFLRAT